MRSEPTASLGAPRVGGCAETAALPTKTNGVCTPPSALTGDSVSVGRVDSVSDAGMPVHTGRHSSGNRRVPPGQGRLATPWPRTGRCAHDAHSAHSPSEPVQEPVQVDAVH